MSTGWHDSAAAWIADMGERGDLSRTHVLDSPMLARARALPRGRALDVGCGEGRFCRMLRAEGFDTVGIDPTEPLLVQARLRDPDGDYRAAGAERLDLPDAHFSLVVSYLTLIDIEDYRAAIAEMARVLAPGGALLIANLTSYSTASVSESWTRDADGAERFQIDHYLEERVRWVGWRGIRIQNWHRPLAAYMSALIDQGLVLSHFDEPAPHPDHPKATRYRRVPWFLVMEWRKPCV